MFRLTTALGFGGLCLALLLTGPGAPGQDKEPPVKASQAIRSAWLGIRIVWSKSDGRPRSPRETVRLGPSTDCKSASTRLFAVAVVASRRRLPGIVRTMRSMNR